MRRTVSQGDRKGHRRVSDQSRLFLPSFAHIFDLYLGRGRVLDTQTCLSSLSQPHPTCTSLTVQFVNPSFRLNPTIPPQEPATATTTTSYDPSRALTALLAFPPLSQTARPQNIGLDPRLISELICRLIIRLFIPLGSLRPRHHLRRPRSTITHLARPPIPFLLRPLHPLLVVAQAVMEVLITTLSPPMTSPSRMVSTRVSDPNHPSRTCSPSRARKNPSMLPQSACVRAQTA